MLLQWHVTDRCNLRCRHCYQDAYAGDELPPEGLDAVLDQYEALLARWRSRRAAGRPRGRVTITGGEPFLRPDLFDLLEAVRRRGHALALLTNGTLIDAPVARRLRRLRPAFVQVSVEGGRATHDAQRGPGTFDRAAEAIRLLAAHRVRTLVAFSAHRGNFREFPDAAALAAECGAARIWADRVIPCGAARRQELLSPAETREFFEIVRATRTAVRRRWLRRTEVAMHRALQFLVGGGAAYRCAAGRTLLALMPNGDVYPCRRMPVRVGNVLETRLADVYRDAPLLRALRAADRPPRGCETCPYAPRCGGGLRCLSHAVHGDPFSADPGCWLAREPPR